MTDSLTYDFAVLGGGSAGYAAARTALDLGLATAVIDGADELGGLCILRGCMPSKTLIESANRNLAMRHAGRFGLHAKLGEPDTRFIRDRKRLLIEDFSSYRQGQLQAGRFDLHRGKARIEKATGDAVSLFVAMNEGSSQQISAKTVLIATGSVIQAPNIPGLAECGYWTSDTILDAAEIPASFIVLGGGAIALEMAHYLEGIGRKVTVLQRSAHVLSMMDSDVADVVQKAFEKRGMDVHCGTKIVRVEKTAQGKRIVYEKHGQEQSVEAEEVLVALGRKPAIEGLGLDRLGTEMLTDGRLTASSAMQTRHPRIFAAGDVCSPVEVVHIAIQQGEIAAKNAAALIQGKPLPHSLDYRCKLFGVFTEPQTAAVGLSEAEATAQGLDFIVASYPFNDHGKSMVIGETEGFVKLLAERGTGRLVGGAVVGPEATEGFIHEVAVAMHLNATARDLASAPHYHPTLSEIWTYPAEEIADALQSS